jgi:hypothetical protein
MMACLVRESVTRPDPDGVVERVARACSPRVLPVGGNAAIFDASGLTRAIGAPEEMARQIHRLAAEAGLVLRVALASTMTSAWLLAHARPGTTIVLPGGDAAALAPLPLTDVDLGCDRADTQVRPYRGSGAGARGRASARHYRIAPGPHVAAVAQSGAMEPPAVRPADAPFADTLDILQRWGLRTLGDLARLPRADVHARLGAFGVRLHQAACGEDASTFQPADESRPIHERLDLEWPIEGLEPLSFALARLCDALETRLERADRGAIVVTTRLILVTRETHTRVLALPAAMRDARLLRTLILLDLESHPPGAGIDAVEIQVDVAPGRIVQGTLLARPLPSAEQLTTLLARLRALMGESRVGAPALVDSHDEREVAMAEFTVDQTPVGRAFRPGVSRAEGTEQGRNQAAVKGRRSVNRVEPPSLPSRSQPPRGIEDGTETKPGGRAGTEVGESGPTSVPDSAFSATLLNRGGIQRWTGIVARTALRRFRLPIAARVVTDRQMPAEVWPSARRLPGGKVIARAGPWRSSGRWWALDGSGWDRDVWDVEIAAGEVYRVSRDRATSRWTIEGVAD